MMKIIIIGAILLMVFLIGCTKEATTEKVTTTTTEEAATGVTSGVDDIGTLDEDLDLSELEDIDAELADINW